MEQHRAKTKLQKRARTWIKPSDTGSKPVSISFWCQILAIILINFHICTKKKKSWSIFRTNNTNTFLVVMTYDYFRVFIKLNRIKYMEANCSSWWSYNLETRENGETISFFYETRDTISYHTWKSVSWYTVVYYMRFLMKQPAWKILILRQVQALAERINEHLLAF